MDSPAPRWIQGRIEERDGFPRVDWEPITAEVSTLPESEWHDAYSSAAREWLQELCAFLGGDYGLVESPNFLLLSPHPTKAAVGLARFLERIREQILTRLLPGVAMQSGYGKHVVLVFADIETYYSYIAHFYTSDGEYGGSAGVFLHCPGGYGHFVSYGREMMDIEATVAHELTHNCLMHLDLPLWLNEGLAQASERALVGRVPLVVDAEHMRDHRDTWGDGVIQEFWSGSAFEATDDRQRLAYHMAELMVRALSREPARLNEFVQRAASGDSGDAASQELFGRGLGALMEQFLGPGAWDPLPATWAPEAARDDEAVSE